MATQIELEPDIGGVSSGSIIINAADAFGLVGGNDFIEIYCSADLGVCETRDTKGLYAKARNGEIKDFTGISSPYEDPQSPELKIDTGNLEIDKCVDIVTNLLVNKKIISKIS